MSTTTDPWAAASSNAAPADSGTSAPSASAGQLAAAKSAAGITDPFGTSSQFAGQGGGTWDPRVPFDDLADRTLVMVPRVFDPAAIDRFNPGQTREEWRVDIVILDGEPFEFTYKSRDSKDAEPTEKTFSVDSFPAVFRSQSVAQGQLIKLLKGVDGDPEKLFACGVLKRVPQWRDAGKYTIESIEESRQAYIAQVQKTGRTEPDIRQRSTWNLIDDPQYMTAERWNLARAWWEKAKTTWPNLT